MKRPLGLLMLLLPLGSQAQGSSTPADRCCESKYATTVLDSLPLEELGREFRRLHGKRCEDCDRFGSDLMDMMHVLGERLNGSNERTVLRVMGRPDAWEDGELIYEWRGGHDHLKFLFDQEGKARSKWYHAYE
jgi:hypothetical protein